MKKHITLHKNLLTVLILVILGISFSQVRSKDMCNYQVIYVTGNGINSALMTLKKIKPNEQPYEDNYFYKFDLMHNKLLKSNERENRLNSIVASPDCQWFGESRNVWVNEKGEKLITKLPNNILEYVWSPKGDKIAYIVGKYIYAETPLPIPSEVAKGVWIYDLKTHTKKLIDIDAYLLAWPAFDNNLYIDNTSRQGNIVRYRPDTGKLEPTPYKGLNFSPTGRYYFIPSIEGEAWRLFQRDPHGELKDIELDIDKNANTSAVHQWLSDGHSILFGDKMNSSTKFLVYDIEKEKVTKTIEGAFLGLDKGKKRGLFMKGIDQFEVVDLLCGTK